MTKWIVLTVSLGLMVSCNKRAPEPAAKAEKAEEPEGFAVTKWGARTELFMEYPALIAGQTGRFAVHLTRLDNFKPVRSGKVEVQLASAGGVQRVSADGPSRPGIFGVDVKPDKAGDYIMTIELRSAEANDSHTVGTVTVFGDVAAAMKHPVEEPKEETIPFLKEQQWALDFATEPVGQQTARSSVEVPGEVQARAGSQGDVIAPLDGRLVEAVTIPIGHTISKGQIVARIAPPTSAPADLPSLQLAKVEADNALRFATRDRERVQRLVDAGAVPGRRMEEARHNATTAAARLKTAEERIAQYETTREAGADPASRWFAVKAPLSGTVIESRAVAGGNVRAGDVLFRVMDIDRVYVTANVPEGEMPRLRQMSGAEVQAADEVPRPIGNLVSIGRIVDPQSRTVPVIYEVENRDKRLAIGQSVRVRLFTAASETAPAVREAAVVDDAGRPVVFVQLSGEAFARRPVKLGNRQKEYVQILEGVRPGERVVTKGAYLIRLAAMSSSIPAHGHVH
jgi:membrane fusion protein, heavy metal efflux system